MTQVILAFHVMVAVSLIGVILLQQSEGGGLGLGSSGGMGNFMSPRGTANLLTRATAILAALFFVTSLTLVVMGGTHKSANTSILDAVEQSSPNADPAVPTVPVVPSAPAAPAVPTGQ